MTPLFGHQMRLLIAVKFLEEILALTNRPNLQALIVVYHHYIIKVFRYDNDDISVLHGRRVHFFMYSSKVSEVSPAMCETQMKMLLRTSSGAFS